MVAAQRNVAIAAALLALYLWRRQRTGVVTIGPVEQVGAIGNTIAPGGMDLPSPWTSDILCKGAPLNSFAERCKGITWTDSPDTGYPIDLRSKVSQQ